MSLNVVYGWRQFLLVIILYYKMANAQSWEEKYIHWAVIEDSYIYICVNQQMRQTFTLDVHTSGNC